MSGRFISPARVGGTGVPLVQAIELASSQTFVRGALVVVNSDGLLAECASDPTSIKGVALADANTSPGEQAANNPLVITGLENTVSVATAADTIFSCRGVNSGTDPVTPTQTMIGEQYGVTTDSDDVWVLDLAETSVKVSTIVDVDIDNKIFFVKFISATMQA